MKKIKIFKLDFEIKQIILFSLIFISLSIFSLIFSATIIFLLEKLPFNKFKILTLISLYSKAITLKVFLGMEIISLALSTFFMIDWRWYKSKQIKITDNISIPQEVGQGQYGSAKFADKKMFDTIFNFTIIDLLDNKQLVLKSKKVYDFIENYKNEIQDEIEKNDI